MMGTKGYRTKLNDALKKSLEGFHKKESKQR